MASHCYVHQTFCFATFYVSSAEAPRGWGRWIGEKRRCGWDDGRSPRAFFSPLPSLRTAYTAKEHKRGKEHERFSAEESATSSLPLPSPSWFSRKIRIQIIRENFTENTAISETCSETPKKACNTNENICRCCSFNDPINTYGYICSKCFRQIKG